MSSMVALKAYLKLIYFDFGFARGSFHALVNRRAQTTPSSNKVSAARCGRGNLCCSRFGVHLVLERSALLAKVSGYNVASQKAMVSRRSW